MREAQGLGYLILLGRGDDQRRHGPTGEGRSPLLAHCRLRLPPVFQLGVGRRSEGCWVQALPGQTLREEVERRRGWGKKVSVLFEDSAEATQALTNAPNPRHFKARSPLEEGEEECSDSPCVRSSRFSKRVFVDGHHTMLHARPQGTIRLATTPGYRWPRGPRAAEYSTPVRASRLPSACAASVPARATRSSRPTRRRVSRSG